MRWGWARREGPRMPGVRAYSEVRTGQVGRAAVQVTMLREAGLIEQLVCVQ